MEFQFHDEVKFETLGIEVARDVVFYSFIVQKSLNHLDLSTCENTLRLKSICTEEQCRKLIEPRRQILYTLNLDLPKNLEGSLGDVTPNTYDHEEFEAFHLGAIFVCDCVYTSNLGICMIQPVMAAKNTIEKLRRYLNVIKLLKLNQCMRTNMLLFDHLILALYPFCTDSNLVIDFAMTLDFCYWVFYAESPMMVGYVLYHAMRIKYNILQVPEWKLDPINGCILFRKPGNISTLLEFGITLRFQPQIYLAVLTKLLQPRRIRRLRRNIPHRRLFLILQLFYYYVFNNRSWEGLLYIWRSIPDPSLTKSEIFYLFEKVISLRDFHNIIELYTFYIIEEAPGIDDAVPRPLQHLCRVTIRNALIGNYQLPFGITQLDIPPLLKDYLNLKC